MAHILVGKYITRMRLAEDRHAILFRTLQGNIIARCDADCCSHTWISDIDLPVNGFPARVLSAEDIALPSREDTHEDAYKSHVKFYGFKIVTDKGEIVIHYRNESNGYYGGELVWPDGYRFYGGVYGQNKSNEKWRDIENA